MTMIRKAFSLLLALSLLLGLGVTAFAAEPAESTVIYKGTGELFEFAPGSYYTDSDLFQIYKNLMPGAVLDEVVTVKNEDSKTVRIYMGAVLHDEEENPISPKVLEELKADDRKGTLSELEYMHDFLDQLTLTVWLGEMTEANILYTGSPNSLEEGFEDGFVALGEFESGDSATLNVRLEVPIEMGNEYAGRVGEVDWVFVVEEVPEETEPSGNTEATKPTGSDQPETGDDTMIWPLAAVMVIALLAIIVLMVFKRRSDDRSK